MSVNRAALSARILDILTLCAEFLQNTPVPPPSPGELPPEETFLRQIFVLKLAAELTKDGNVNVTSLSQQLALSSR